MANNQENTILISDENQLRALIDRFNQGQTFTALIKFADRSLFLNLLDSLNFTYDASTKRYFFYDYKRKLHVSESDFGYVWVSTAGLVARNKPTSNRAINSCLSQYTVISLLLDKAIEVSQKEDVYDIDSYNSGYLSNLAPAIYHNIIFYIEVLCKAYLSLNEQKPPHTHKLSQLYQLTVDTMLDKKQNNSLFQIQILEPLCNFINHIKTQPSNFKEEYIKYDDNPEDTTIILFQTDNLIEMSIVLELADDFIHDFFYTGQESIYIKSGLYQTLMDKADTDEKKQKIENMYGHLI